MGNPIISVIIPVYNVAAYLPECLDAVGAQTLQLIEIIAVNDGSTDNSLEILQYYARKVPLMKVMDQANAGQSAARNTGLLQAKGTYVHFLDADDYISRDTYHNLVKQMEENNLDLIRFSAVPFLDGINGPLSRKQYDFRRFFTASKVYRRNAFLKVCQKAFSASPCLYVVRKDLLVRNGIRFNPEILLHEDELFTLKLFLCTRRAMYDGNFYYHRRYRSNSVMTQRNNKNKYRSFDAYCMVINNMCSMLDDGMDAAGRALTKRRIQKLYRVASSMQLPADYRSGGLHAGPCLTSFEKKVCNLQGIGMRFIKKLLHRHDYD